jgi:excisionase family DNA binding protein
MKDATVPTPEPSLVLEYLMTLKQVAKGLGVTLSTVYVLRGRGELEVVKVGAKAARVRATEYARYIGTLKKG